MRSAKDIFLKAAREEKAFHICAHMEQAHVRECNNFKQPEHAHFKRAYQKASEFTLLMTENGITNLFTTFKSNPTTPIGPSDISIRSENFSALENQTHLSFLRQSMPSIGLTSGLEAPVCVNKTRQHMKNMGITPIMVTDATDLPSNNYAELRQLAENTWGEDCLTATVGEVGQWIKELHI